MAMRKLDAEAIGLKLRSLRGNRPQNEVADAVGVTCMAISYYEKGKRVPRDAIKIALAEYYKVSVESIFFSN